MRPKEITMALKISEMALLDGRAKMKGVLDDKPFILKGDEGMWRFSTDSGWAHQMPAINMSSLSEARTAAYAAVAAFRNQMRGILA